MHKSVTQTVTQKNSKSQHSQLHAFCYMSEAKLTLLSRGPSRYRRMEAHHHGTQAREFGRSVGQAFGLVAQLKVQKNSQALVNRCRATRLQKDVVKHGTAKSDVEKVFSVLWIYPPGAI